MSKKKRIDIVLHENGMVDSRSEAKTLIMRGDVLYKEQKITKASFLIDDEDISNIRIKKRLQYVSRGGVKLAGALDYFKIEPDGMIGLDIGSSTGGFTDCLLQRGARLIYAVDVGRAQFAYKLRDDERIILNEKTNFRTFDVNILKHKIDIIVCDVSFISLLNLLEKINEVFDVHTIAVLLIKPQFEVGKGMTDRGIVRDPILQEKVIIRIRDEFSEKGIFMNGLHYSQIKGPKGNIEYTAFFSRKDNSLLNDETIHNKVKDAWNDL